MVPAVVLSPGLLLAALWGVTQPVSKSNADPAKAENIDVDVGNYLIPLKRMRNSTLRVVAGLRLWRRFATRTFIGQKCALDRCAPMITSQFT